MRVHIATPCHRGSKDALDAIAKWNADTSKSLGIEGRQSIVLNCPWLDAARANLAAEFMAQDCDLLLFRDDDVDIHHDTLRRMIESAAPVTIAPYRMRDAPHDWTVNLDERGRVIEAGLGAAAISRAVIETLWRECPTYDQDGAERSAMFVHMLVGRRLLKEDHAFFRRVRGAGFEIEAVEGAKCNHGGVVSHWVNRAAW